MVFPFVAGLIDRATWIVQLALMTRLNTAYSGLVHSLKDYKRLGYSDVFRVEKMGGRTQQFKLFLKIDVRGTL